MHDFSSLIRSRDTDNHICHCMLTQKVFVKNVLLRIINKKTFIKKFFWYKVNLGSQLVAVISNFVKLNFKLFWPMCNIRNSNFAIFNARKITIFTTDPLPALFQNKVVKLFQSHLQVFLNHRKQAKMYDVFQHFPSLGLNKTQWFWIFRIHNFLPMKQLTECKLTWSQLFHGQILMDFKNSKSLCFV